MQPPDPNQPFEPQQPSIPGGPPPPGYIPAYNQPLPAGPGGPGYPGPYGPRPPEVNFDVIGEAWKLFQQQMGTWIAAVLIVGIITGGISFTLGLAIGISAPPSTRSPDSISDVLNGTRLGGELVIRLVTGLLSMIFSAGLFRMAIRQVRGQQISVGDMFSVVDVLGSVIGTAILVGIFAFLGLMCCILPIFVVYGTTMFAMPLVVDARLGPVDAISRSWETLKPQWLMAAIFYFVVSLLASLGILLCCVGILFTAPLMPLSIAVLYRDFFIGPNMVPQPLGTPTLNYPPPIPEA